MHALIQDIRYGVRMLYKTPTFTVIAILTLALGIGATAAVFSVVNAVLLEPLPFRSPEQLVMVWGVNSKDNNPENPASFQDYEDFKDQNQSFEQMAAVSPRWTMNLTGGVEPEQIGAMFASADLFPLLGVSPAIGQPFTAEHDREGGERVVVISHGLWQRQFGQDPNIVGKQLNLDGTPGTILGVMPAGFQFIEDVDLWVPLALNPLIARGRGVRLFSIIGRLKSDVTIEQAQADMASIASRLQQQYVASNTGLGVRLVGLHKQMTKNIGMLLYVLLGAVVFVLLIACANVANLLLARSSARQKEIAIRSALGATRARLARQFLTESVLLAVAGGGAGLLLSVWGIDLLLALSPGNIPRQSDIRISSDVMLFAAAVSLVTGIIFGLAPALGLSRPNLNETLKEGGRAVGASSRQQRFRNGLVAAEIALALVLLVGAGLLVRSFAKLLDVNPGYATENILTFSTGLPSTRYSQPAERAAFYNQFEERVKSLPEITSVGAVTRLPLLNPANNNITSEIAIEGRPMPVGQSYEVDFRRATTDYFQTMGIPLIEGRMFTVEDVLSNNVVAVVNLAMAKRFWPSESAIGKRFRHTPITETTPWITIVGVVGNVRHLAIDIEPRPEIYRHYMTLPAFNPVMVARTKGDPLDSVAAIRSHLRELDPELSLASVNTMEQLSARSVAGRRFSMTILGIFAGVALVLAAVGIYGVVSYSVTQQTREIGVRMALGATSKDVLKMIIGRALMLAAVGIVAGVVAARALTWLMSGLLFEVSAADTLTFAVIPLLLGGLVLLASYIPARRATKVDPMIALRYE
jgi:putative ABC transport system permease protein